MSTEPIVIRKSPWSNTIYPCSAVKCDFVGTLDAWTYGHCYNPCPRCGSRRVQRTGRFVYEVVSVSRWLPFLKRKKFIGVEWHS